MEQNNKIINDIKQFLLLKNYYVGVQEQDNGILLNLPQNILQQMDLYVAEYIIEPQKIKVINSLNINREFDVPNYVIKPAISIEINWISKGINYNPEFILLFDKEGNFIEDSEYTVYELVNLTLTSEEFDKETTLLNIILKTINNDFYDYSKEAEKENILEGYKFIYETVLNKGE